jgi:SAM-dependent MidA family methyltransferase
MLWARWVSGAGIHRAKNESGDGNLAKSHPGAGHLAPPSGGRVGDARGWDHMSDASSDPRGPAFSLVAERIAREGPMPFDRFVELALYAPDVGFYESGGAAGRARGDFVTSPEIGPLFGAVLAQALDRWWDDLDRPDPFTVLDVGTGPGTLALAVRAARPRCGPALEYVLVERSAAQRQLHGEHLELSLVGGEPGRGPRFVSRADLPAQRIVGVVLANELLDNLPFGILERTARGWRSVHVGLDDEGGLVEVLVDAEPADVARVEAALPDAPPGCRVPLARAAAGWIEEALVRLERGRLVVFDYGAATADLATRDGQWLRTYRRHERGGRPLELPGAQDITADVAVDQLPSPTTDRSQADFLAAHGIQALVDEGRRVWVERAHLGDLEALRGRSRIGEAEALTDPDGLGAFRVLEWVVG